MMQINVNGEKKKCPTGSSVYKLLESLNIDKRYVAVELNHKIVPRTQLNEIMLQENDSLEIVTFVGGG
ncbi:MAG: sulfur carrier protein ThiS [Thermodesulfobacteriota bacterium]